MAAILVPTTLFERRQPNSTDMAAPPVVRLAAQRRWRSQVGRGLVPFLGKIVDSPAVHLGTQIDGVCVGLVQVQAPVHPV